MFIREHCSGVFMREVHDFGGSVWTESEVLNDMCCFLWLRFGFDGELRVRRTAFGTAPNWDCNEEKPSLANSPKIKQRKMLKLLFAVHVGQPTVAVDRSEWRCLLPPLGVARGFTRGRSWRHCSGVAHRWRRVAGTQTRQVEPLLSVVNELRKRIQRFLQVDPWKHLTNTLIL